MKNQKAQVQSYRPMSAVLCGIAIAVGCACAATAAQAQDSTTTRKDVKQQLVRAEANGTVPTSNAQYPATPATKARNRKLYKERHETHSGASNTP